MYLLFPAEVTIEWEQDLYVFEEGGNATYMICAVTDDIIAGDRIEERLVIFRNDSALGGPSSNYTCAYMYVHYDAVLLGAVVHLNLTQMRML